MTQKNPQHYPLQKLQPLLESEHLSGFILAGCILTITTILFSQLAYAAVIAVSLAVVLMPLQNRLSRSYAPGYAAVGVCSLVVVAILIFFLILANTILVYRVYIFEVASTISEAIGSFKPDSGTLSSWIFSSLSTFTHGSGSTGLIENAAPVVIDSLTSIAQSIPALAVQVIIINLLLFLLLRNGEGMATEFISVLPSRVHHYLTILWNVVSDTMYGVYVVNISVAIMTFFITLPFFWILGYGQIIFWAFICAASHLFPFFGPQLITVILAIYAVSKGDLRGLALIAVVGYPLISGIQDFWIRPRLLAKRIAMHPALMMIGLFGGMLIMGAVGLIIGPLIVALADASYNILSDIRKEIQSSDEKNGCPD